MLLLGLALAVLAGPTLGLLGGGGSILTVPVLVHVLGFAAKPAIAMSLPVVGVTSLVGAALHWRIGNVRVPTALTFGIVAMAGAFAGARVATHMTGAAQLALLALVMLAAAALAARVPGAALRRGFAVFLLVMDTAVLYQNRAAFGGADAAPPDAAAR